MIDAAVDALRRDGVAGMSFTDVLLSSGAARGAIYHHFPGGKSELVIEAVTRNAGEVRDRLAELPHGPPRLVVDEFMSLIRPVVEQSTEGSGCATAAAAMSASDQRDHASIQHSAAAAITSWIDVLRERFHAGGIELVNRATDDVGKGGVSGLSADLDQGGGEARQDLALALWREGSAGRGDCDGHR